MARTQKSYNCFLAEVVKNEWTDTGGGTALQAIGKESVELTETTEAPSTAKRLEASSGTGKIEVKFKAPALAEGEVIVAAKLHINHNTTNGKKGFKATLSGSSFEPEGKGSQIWAASSLAGSTAESYNVKEVLEGAVCTITHIGSSGSKIYEIYLSVETETETAGFLSVKGTGAGTATAGGEYELTLEGSYTGNYMIVAVATSEGKGAGKVTDDEGNTWQKDAEHSDGATCTVQIWSAKIAKDPKKLKLAELKASAIVEVSAALFTPIQENSRVDQTGSGEGVGTAIKAGPTAALRGQGDLAIAAWSTTGKSEVKKPSAGWTDIASGKQIGGSLGWSFNKTPSESAALTAEDEFGETGTWAGAVVTYKVLATETTASMAMVV